MPKKFQEENTPLKYILLNQSFYLILRRLYVEQKFVHKAAVMPKTIDNKLKLVLFILAILLYANTIGHDYAWDDSIVITENPRVKKGISGIPDLFLKYNSDFKSDKYGYRPIVLTSFAIEYGLFKDIPQVGHFMNVLCFALLCSVMFGVLRKIFYKLSNLAPFLITLIFLVHPVHVEVVANIKSRDEIFALLFSLLSLNYLIEYNNSNSFKFILFSAISFVAAFLSKESAISFVFIMPVTLLYMNGKESLKKLIVPTSFTLLLLLVGIIISQLSMNSELGKEAGEGAGIFYENGILGNSFFHTDLFNLKLANAFTLLILYLKSFFWPLKQLYYYGYNQIPVAAWSDSVVILSLFLNLVLLVFAVVGFKKHKEISLGILFFFISISIYLHLFRTIADTMADRFMFVPSLGLSIVLVFGLGKLLKIDFIKHKTESILDLVKSNSKIPKEMQTLKYVFLILSFLLGVKTYSRNKIWKNNYTLISTDMPSLENCARAHNYMANELKSKLSKNYDEKTESEMIAHYKKSIAISKDSYYSFIGLGTYYNGSQKYDYAIPLLDSMVRVFPKQADSHYYLGEALFKSGDAKRAIPYLETSMKLAPEVFTTYFTLSMAYSRKGEFDKAIALISSAEKKFSPSSRTYEALGVIYFDKGDMEQSTKNTLETIRYGADPQLVYKIVIGRYQYKKQDSLATLYYREAYAKGIFKGQIR